MSSFLRDLNRAPPVWRTSLGLIPPMAILGFFFFTRYSVIPLYCLFVGMGIAIGLEGYQCVGARCGEM